MQQLEKSQAMLSLDELHETQGSHSCSQNLSQGSSVSARGRFFAALQNLLGLFTLGNVLNLRDEVKRPVVTVAHQGATEMNPDNAA